MPAWLVLAVCALATVRLTRLVIEDTIADRPRTWLAARLPMGLVQLLICQWCAGFWIAGVTVAFARLTRLTLISPWACVLAWAGVAGAAGLLYRRPDGAVPQ